MKLTLALLTTLLLVAGQAFAIEPEAKIIAQAGAPLTITSYSAAYQMGGRYTTEGIQHNVEYKNTGDKPVVAVQIGLVSFDVWNEFLDRSGGVSIEEVEPGASMKGTWVARAYAVSFLTGVAYVSKVRFADGTIWAADLDAVAEELRKIEKDFDVMKLKGKPEKE